MALPEKLPYERLSNYLKRNVPKLLKEGKSRGTATAELIAKFNEEPVKKIDRGYFLNKTIQTTGGIGKPVSSDPDVQAYIDTIYALPATLTPTEVDAVEEMIIGMKEDNIWGDLNYVFPLIGSDLDARRVNAKTPEDEGSYLQYNNNWIITQYGIQSVGSGGYLNILSGSSPSTTADNRAGIIYRYTTNTNTGALFGNHVSGSNGGQMFLLNASAYEDDFNDCGADIPNAPADMYSSNFPCGTADKNIGNWFGTSDAMWRIYYNINQSTGQGTFSYRSGTAAEGSSTGNSTAGRMTINGAYDSNTDSVRYTIDTSTYSFIATSDIELGHTLKEERLMERTSDFMERLGRVSSGYTYPAGY